MYKGFSDFTVEEFACEQPCVAILFISAFSGCVLVAKNFCFQLYQFNTTEKEVDIKAFACPGSSRGSPEGWH